MNAADVIDPAAVDAVAGSYHSRHGQPGLAYGIVAGGRLVHAGGHGHRWRDGPRPDARTVFRIASMTKSFTAAAVLALRDDGALALDDPAGMHVPELRGLRASADAPPVSIRHLLTMTAGFPTDDPWGDRHQGLPLPEFSRLLRRGVSFAWAPGTRFEYSNLGYAILGLVIAAASGMAYPDFVRGRLLRPLGLSRTGFEAAEFDPAGLALGYRRGAGGWEELVPDGCGAFAPMGGIFSCVADLGHWVCGFAAAYPPGDPAAGGPHPLSRAARREMQSPQVARPPGPRRLPGGPGGPVSYGFGLFAEDDPDWGRVVSHSGGYPGFGSHMRWHPATGTGAIVLANSTYAATQPLAARLLGMALRESGAGGTPMPGPGPAFAPHWPWPATLAAREQVDRLLLAWDDAAADRLFSANVAQDEPIADRRHEIGLISERIGGLGKHPERPAEFDTPAHCRWWLRGERGVVQAEIRLTPEARPRVQSLSLAVPPPVGSPLARTLEALLSLLNDGASDWPSTLPVPAGVDTESLLRQLRMAGVWAGRCRQGAFRDGDGETSVTVELDGEHARLILTVATDAAGRLQRADLTFGG